MALVRVTAEWTGFNGGPGYSAFHFDALTPMADIQGLQARVAGLFYEIRPQLPEDVRVTVRPTSEIIDEVTGELIDYVEPEEAQSGYSGAASGGYSGASGAVINWNTATVARGRRVRGRTFLVPLAGAAYDDVGTLTSSTLSNLGRGADALYGGEADPDFCVWSRPRNGSGGVLAPVISHRIPDLAAILRSRRD